MRQITNNLVACLHHSFSALPNQLGRYCLRRIPSQNTNYAGARTVRGRLRTAFVVSEAAVGNSAFGSVPTNDSPQRLCGQTRLMPLEVVIRCFVLSLLLLSASHVAAQNKPAKTQDSQPLLASYPDWPKADPADVARIEDVVHAFYSAISTPAGEKLNQTRLRSLFVPHGRIAVSIPPTPSRAADVVFFSVEGYAAKYGAETSTGFFDSNPANQIETFGGMAHVYSTFESRRHLADPKPMASGIKSFELLKSGDRWHIVEVYWDWERPDNPIPVRYLHDSSR